MANDKDAYFSLFGDLADTVKYGPHLGCLMRIGVANISGVEEKNRRLQILLSELLQKNHELHLEVAHLHGED